MPAHEDFQQIEKSVDSHINTLIFGKSVRQIHALLTATSYYGSIDMARSVPKPEHERSVLSARIGYVVPLLSSAIWNDDEVSADSALWSFGEVDKQAAIANDLIAYSQFCELAPFIHRECYTASVQNGCLRIAHPSESYREIEEKDIVLSNLALPFTISTPFANDSWFDQQVENLPTVDANMPTILRAMAEWFTDYTFEALPLSSEAMKATLGVDEGEFRRFVGACMSIGQLCISMADAILRKSFADQKIGDCAEAGAEFREWIAPCLKRSWLIDQLKQAGQLSETAANRLLDLYLVTSKKDWGRGEGFAPPFVQVGQHVVFAPLAIRHSMSFRNALFTLHHRDEKAFDEVYSKHLEPRLIDLAKQAFRENFTFVLSSNFTWEKGELDLIVYDLASNTALIIEVKGALMPEGARMVKRVEGRLREGITQIEKLKILSNAERDSLLSRALSLDLKNVNVRYGLLTWAGFGTDAIWRKLTDIAPLNIHILSKLLRRTPAVPLKDFPAGAHMLIAEIVKLADIKWTNAEGRCGMLQYVYPKMGCDWLKVNKITREYFTKKSG